MIIKKNNLIITLPHPTEMREYCENEMFKAECHREGEVIVVRKALYGRMRVGRCLQGNMHIGCRSNVLTEVTGNCDCNCDFN